MNIAQMLNKLEVSLPGEVVNRLERHAEVQRQQEFFLRMLKPEEVREMLDALSDFEVFESILPFVEDEDPYVRERALATVKRHGMSVGKLKRELHVRGETGMGK